MRIACFARSSDESGMRDISYTSRSSDAYFIHIHILYFQ